MNSDTGEIRRYLTQQEAELAKSEGFNLELSDEEFDVLVNENKELRNELLTKMRNSQWGKNYFNKGKSND